MLRLQINKFKINFCRFVFNCLITQFTNLVLIFTYKYLFIIRELLFSVHIQMGIITMSEMAKNNCFFVNQIFQDIFGSLEIFKKYRHK